MPEGLKGCSVPVYIKIISVVRILNLRFPRLLSSSAQSSSNYHHSGLSSNITPQKWFNVQWPYSQGTLYITYSTYHYLKLLICLITCLLCGLSSSKHYIQGNKLLYSRDFVHLVLDTQYLEHSLQLAGPKEILIEWINTWMSPTELHFQSFSRP